jgi:hypothetical protein
MFASLKVTEQAKEYYWQTTRHLNQAGTAG